MTQPFVPSIAEPKDDTRGTPLLEFRGRLNQYVVRDQHFEPNANNPKARDAKFVDFDFTEVVVIRAIETYVLPIGKVPLPYSDRADTRWAALTKSIRNVIPGDVWTSSSDPLGLLVGKVQHWNFGPGATLRAPVKDDKGEDVYENGRQKWGPTDADTWQLVSCEGFGQAGVHINDLVVEFAVGKTMDQVNQELLTNMQWKQVTGYQSAVEATLNRSLLPMLVAGGKLVLNADGTYQKGGS